MKLHEAQVIFLSHSGGKDSQAALAQLKKEGLLSKVVIVHSNLGEMEWEHMTPWVEKNSFGLPVHEVQAEEDFFEMCYRVGKIPSGNMQFCTDNLKTQPIAGFIRSYMYEHGITKAINATGMRAAESKTRAKKSKYCMSKGRHTSGMMMPKKHPTLEIWDYHPCFDFSEQDVYDIIEEVGQTVHHVYSLGFSRLSCVMCVNGRVDEHAKAIQLRPELARKVAKLERDLGKTYRMRSIKGVKVNWYMDEKFDIPNCEEEFTAPNLLDLLGIA